MEVLICKVSQYQSKKPKDKKLTSKEEEKKDSVDQFFLKMENDLLRGSQMLNQLYMQATLLLRLTKVWIITIIILKKKKSKKETTQLALGASMFSNYFRSYENPTLQHQSLVGITESLFSQIMPLVCNINC